MADTSETLVEAAAPEVAPAVEPPVVPASTATVEPGATAPAPDVAGTPAVVTTTSEVSSTMSEGETALLQTAAVHEQRNELDSAVTVYEQVLAQNPYSVHALSQLASICRHQERFPDAVMYLQRIVQLDSSNGELHGAVGHCYLMLSQRSSKIPAVLQALWHGYQAYSKAILHLQDGHDPNLWYGIGLLYERYGALMMPCNEQMAALKHSAEALSAVLRMDPAFEKRAEIYYRLGLIFKQQGHVQQSLECFRAICEQPPPPLKQADIWFQIGHVHESIEPASPTLAKQAYEHVLRLAEHTQDTKISRTLRQLGWTCHTSGLRGAMPALLYLQRAIESDPADGQSWHLLGKCLADHGQLTGAYDCFQQAALRESTSHELWASIGALYVQARQESDAVIAYRRAVTLNPNSQAWMQYASSLEACAVSGNDLAMCDAAMEAYTQAIKVIPAQEADIRSRMQGLTALREQVQNGTASSSVAAEGSSSTLPGLPKSDDPMLAEATVEASAEVAIAAASVDTAPMDTSEPLATTTIPEASASVQTSSEVSAAIAASGALPLEAADTLPLPFAPEASE